MSSFQRRAPSRSVPLPAGVRPSPTSNSVPFLSTGLPALDDIISGRGQPASSAFTIIPTVGTASADLCSSEQSWNSDGMARAAAEPYADIVLAYSLAQGLVADHASILIGQDADAFAHSILAQAGEESAEHSKAAPKPTDIEDGDEDDAHNPSHTSPDKGKKKEMDIAWRYEKMKQFQTTVESAAAASRTQSHDEQMRFCATFDLSKRVYASKIRQAKEHGNLHLCELDPLLNLSGSSSFEMAWNAILDEVERCKAKAEQSSSTSPPPALRILVRSLGSSAWTVKRGQTRERETVRFLLRLRHLLRSLCSPWLGRRTGDVTKPGTGLVAIATLTVSASLLACPTSCNIAHRIAHLSDTCVLLSSFAATPSLRQAFPSYTGGLGIACTPSLGTLANLSIRASVLRGMGAGGAGMEGKTMEGGAGGAENNLAFKLRRKKLVVETLHLDIDGGVSERRTKPIKKTADASGPTSSPQGHPAGSETDHAANMPQSPLPDTSTPLKKTVARPDIAPGPAPRPSAFVKGGGLSALRARGLDAQKSSSFPTARPPGGPPKQIQIDGTDDLQSAPDVHAPTHERKAPHREPVFKSSRAEDYEF